MGRWTIAASPGALVAAFVARPERHDRENLCSPRGPFVPGRSGWPCHNEAVIDRPGHNGLIREAG